MKASTMTRNYFNYFTEIEEHFVRKRARNLLVSPLDWCLIELWKENGIPLHVALRGIDRSFESAENLRKSKPRTLFYCHPAVLAAYEEYQEAMVGQSTQDQKDTEEAKELFSQDAMLQFMVELREQLSDREGEAFSRAISRLDSLINECSARGDLDPREVDRELTEIGSVLVRTLRTDLDSTVWKGIQTASRKELKIYKKHLSAEMFERIKEKQIERSLRDYFDLPEFSLLSCT